MAVSKILLSEEDSAIIRDAIASGEYASESEVVSAALQGLRTDLNSDFWQSEEVRKKIQEGFDQLDRGEYTSVPLDKVGAFLDEIEHDSDTDPEA